MAEAGDAGETPEARQGDPNAPAGWYPDTQRGGGLRYWDGSKWTEDRTLEVGAKPLKSRAAWAVGGVALAMLMSFVYGLLALDYADTLRTQIDDGSLTLSEAEDAEIILGLGGLAYVLGVIGAAVAFLIWFHRAYSNLPALTGGALRYKTTWAGWSWFIPIFNLFRPKQTIRC
ncbi:hypothetical protein BH20ACT15_BH20ACT15_01250 [soil metagenome]